MKGTVLVKSVKSVKRFCLLCLMVMSTLAAPAAHAEPVETVTGSYWYIVDNIKDLGPEANLRLWVALPPEQSGQKVHITDIQPPPVEILHETRHGNRIVSWQVSPALGTETILCHFDFEAMFSPDLPRVDPEAISPYATDSILYRDFTGPEYLVETGEEMTALAQEIAGAETNPYRQARLIFDWMITSLEFVPGGTPDRSALATSRGRRGDCGQYSLLFTALCRSLGIPARTVTMVWFSGGRHIMAEFYLNGFGWLPADPAAGQILLPEFEALTAGEIDAFLRTRSIPKGDPGWLFSHHYGHRLIVAVGNNLEIGTPGSEEKLVFTFLEPGGANALPPAIRLVGFNEDVVHGGFFVFDRELANEEAAHQLAHQRLASLYFDAGLFDLAEEACLKTLEDNPGGISAWINLGRVYLRKGKYSKAEASLRRALTGMAAQRKEKLESTIWVHNYLGNCYDLLGRREMAIAEYELVVGQGMNYRGAVDYARKYLNMPFTESDF